MKMFRFLILLPVLTGILLSAGERDTAQVTGAEVRVGLNGYCAGPSLRMALLEIHLPGQEILCTLREGETAAGVELLAIHAEKGTVTIRQGGVTKEIGFGPLANKSPVSSPPERAPETEAQKDASHGEYHKLRARLERERDAFQNADSE